MLVYVSGPYRPITRKDCPAISVEDNIEAASQIAVQLWEKGHAVICPHANTAHFERRTADVTPEQYIQGDLNMIARCDALVMVPRWEESEGAAIEEAYARSLGIPIYH